MRYSIRTGSPEKINADCIVVAIWNKGALSDEAKLLDTATQKVITKIIQSGDFTGKLGETQVIHNINGAVGKRILLVGSGDKKKLSGSSVAKLINSALKAVLKLKASSLHFALHSLNVIDRDSNWLAARLAQETEVLNYQYDTTKSKKAKAFTTKSITVSALPGSGRKNTETALKRGQAIGKAVNRARELGNLPGNICTPTYLAQQATIIADRNRSVTTQILSEKQMAMLGLGSL